MFTSSLPLFCFPLPFLFFFFSSCSTDAELLWNHVQLFCLCHGLSPTLEFLEECAIQGQWLPLLCHAQLHRVPPKEVWKQNHTPIIVYTYCYIYMYIHVFVGVTSCREALLELDC